MPFDSFPERVPGSLRCPCCNQPIAAHEPAETIQLPHDPLHGADQINGTYHAECAKPYLNLVGVLDKLNRFV